VNAQLWRDQRVLITGHSGFKGSWLALWLSQLGAKVTGIALEPPTTPSLFALARVSDVVESIRADVRDLEALERICRTCRPGIVFHLAAQSLVRESYRDPVTTFSTNTLGTVNCLEAVRQTDSVRAVVVVTTDKCYRNRGWTSGYRETDELGGVDPYAASKACAEIVTEAYRASFLSSSDRKTLVASARAGNVIGGGDWATDRLVPDAVRAFCSGQSLRVRNASATRPWQHVLDPLHGYLMLGEALLSGDQSAARAWNFGPDAKDVVPVRQIADQLASRWGEQARWEEAAGGDERKEAETLSLDSALARRELGWKPRLPLSSALDWTVDWHKGHQRGHDPRVETLSQIREYGSLASG